VRGVFNEREEESKVRPEAITAGDIRGCIQGNLIIDERKSFRNPDAGTVTSCSFMVMKTLIGLITL